MHTSSQRMTPIVIVRTTGNFKDASEQICRAGFRFPVPERATNAA
jgi:hypothetical protein